MLDNALRPTGSKDSACDNRLVHSTQHAVVVFDGECAFCNRWVNFLLHFDRRDVFRFTARQSESGTAFSRQAGLPEGGIGSIIVVEAGPSADALVCSSSDAQPAWIPVLTDR